MQEDTIIQKNLFEIGKIPMAGVPYHAMERYCADLIKKNYSVVICDQLEKSSGNFVISFFSLLSLPIANKVF